MVVPVQRNPTDPGSRTRMNQAPFSRTRDLHGAIGGATMRLHHKKRCSHVFIDSQTHVPSQGTEFVMNFALRYGGNRTHEKQTPISYGP